MLPDKWVPMAKLVTLCLVVLTGGVGVGRATGESEAEASPELTAQVNANTAAVLGLNTRMHRVQVGVAAIQCRVVLDGQSVSDCLCQVADGHVERLCDPAPAPPFVPPA